MALERIYTVPLRDAFDAKRTVRAKRAMKVIREFIAKHMKASSVRMSIALNSAVWARGIQKIPRRVKVKAVKDDSGLVRVYLPDEKISSPKKEEKKEEKKPEAKKDEKKSETPKAEKKEEKK